MAVGFSNTNKPINPRGNDASPKGYNRASLYSGKALDFDGVNDKITTPNISTQSTNVWTYSSNIVFSSATAYWFDARESDIGYSVYFDSSIKKLILYTTSGITFDFEFEFNKWYSVALTSNSTTANLYVNTQLVDSKNYTNSFSVTGDFFIGQRHTGGSHFGGSLSGFKAFDVALTAAQVADLYNNPELVVPTGVDNTALKLFLPMQEGAGTTAYDGSGNGNHGTISGATYTHGIGAPVSQTAVMNWNKKENLIIRSESIVENQVPGGWAQSSGDPLESSSEADPTGRNTASLINVEALSNSDYFYNYQTPVTSGEEYTFSIWAKLGTAENAVFVLNDITSWNTVSGANYVATSANGYDEWKQLSITFTAPSTNKVNVHIGYHQETGVTQQDLGNFYIWGAAIHKGSTPILVPTFGSAQTSEVLLPQGLTTGRDITGVNLFENVRKQGALNLDGNSWAEVHDNESLDMTTTATMEAWVNCDNLIAAYQIIMVKSSDTYWTGNYGRYVLRANQNNVNWWFDDFTANTKYHTISLSGYNHLVVTKDGTTEKLYINGALVDTETGAATFTASPYSLVIGAQTSYSENWDNQIAQPRIYNRALTAAEVLQNYNSGKNTYK